MADRPDPRELVIGAADRFEFRLFGRFAAVDLRDGGDITPRGRKARALIAFMLTEQGRVPRERLAALLWSERGQAQAQASLRQCLLELRPLTAGFEPFLQVDRTHVELGGASATDLQRIALAAQAGACDELAALLGRGVMLLEDLDGIDPAFDEWLRNVRTRRGEVIAEAGRAAAGRTLGGGDAGAALRLCQELLRIDPLDEGAARIGMKAAAAAGQKQVAHRIYHAVSSALQTELGSAPEAETQAVYRALSAPCVEPPPRLEKKPPEAPPAAPVEGAADDVPMAPAAAAGSRRAPARAIIIGVIALILIGAVAAMLWRSGRAANGPSIVAVVAQPGSGSEAMAAQLLVDLDRLAGTRSNALRVTERMQEADYVVRIAALEAGERPRMDLSLVAGGSGEILWSSSVEPPPGRNLELRPQASAKLGQMLLCALRTPGFRGQLPVAAMRLYMSACERMEDVPDERQVALLRQVTEAAPEFAQGWADLAMAEAGLLNARSFSSQAQGPQAEALMAAAQTHIARARELEPANPSAFVAEAELLGRWQWAERLALIERALQTAPEEPRLHDRHADALFQVGRLTDAIQAAERAAALDPLSVGSRATLIAALAHAGNVERARRELAEAERIWPGSDQLAGVRFSMELRYGDARLAQQMIDRGEASLGGPNGGFGGPQILMRARLDPTPENVAALVRFASTETRSAPHAVALRMQALGQFGAVEEFFGLADQPGVIHNLRGATEVLFRPHMKPFRDDARFPALAARLGLLHYWQASGHWPDFCADPRLPYDCREHAAKLVGARQ
jgi:DNA-binding SARP family transcriptional activator/tetratricopeptide (TPR) repeat protein